MAVEGYTLPETEDGLTENEAGAELLKLAKAFRSSQGQTETGTQSAAPANATEATDEPVEEVEDETPPEASSDETDTTDETLEEEPVEEPTPKQPRGRTLKINGVDTFVSEDEAYNGHLRQADYTRKTQAHSENVKAFEKERTEVRSRRERYDAGLAQIEDALKVMMPQEPDWDRVRAERPTEYPALFTDWQRYQNRLRLVTDERSRVAQEKQAEEAASLTERRKEAAERLYTAIPEWRDHGKRDADRAKLATLAKDYGYSDDEVAAIEDPRLVMTLRDAMLYHDLKAKQAKVKAQIGKAPVGTAKTAKPGVPGSIQRQSTKAQIAQRRLAKSGNVEDAAEAIFHSLRAKKR